MPTARVVFQEKVRHLSGGSKKWSASNGRSLIQRSRAALSPSVRNQTSLQCSQQIDSDRAEAKSMMQESEPMSGRPHRLSPTMLPLLKERVAKLNTFSGFTADSVTFAVAELIRETLEIKDDEADCHTDDPSWLPSERWCLWFLHKEMQLTMRRTNGTPPCPEDEEKQEALHNATILCLCYLIRVENLPLKRVFASDESGCNLLPQAKWRWEQGQER